MNYIYDKNIFKYVFIILNGNTGYFIVFDFIKIKRRIIRLISYHDGDMVARFLSQRNLGKIRK